MIRIETDNHDTIEVSSSRTHVGIGIDDRGRREFAEIWLLRSE